MGFTSIETANRMVAVEKKRKQGGDVVGTLTLRDYFAAQAMQGMLAACTGWSENAQERLAKCSYKMADEMLKEREQ